ncbi:MULTISPECIES: aminotransferase class I/II-fold pyridoxal phosphate-dependent enzyme [Paenibacillus]|uniref:aminotransferase class I/II-fold pyridoxal phosphate-dependent enzyme n=1 Tax=Paenibacillus TaxID=44249 RepID=UPI0022B8791E|nr:aminotransferase class I/II-fold pyridoxal phosphate-dependent enzyme [Paenibacillus caseinilyticus]MCZ8523729.1 hypothetical protein [Paenibacillus caseinilyticus]
MKEDAHQNAPILESLVAHQRSEAHGFHVPGHKSGSAIDADAVELYKNILSVDLTEIPGLDDLHHPEEAILEAQKLAADCFGAEETFFLVGGSTVGNIAMIAAACRRGDLLLVQRDVHKSVLHGLMLAGVRTVFLTPQWDRLTGLSHGVDPGTVASALHSYPEAKGLLVTNPSYYGVSRGLVPLAELLHGQGKLLLVDEAHGAHFGFHDELPQSAMAAGADASVQSTHKMLTAMTMGAMLHVQGALLDRVALRKVLAMLQSSSPSYPILGSLDWSRRLMALSGTERLEKVLQQANRVDVYVNSQKRWVVNRASSALGGSQDRLKMVLADGEGNLDGFQLKSALENQGIYPEMADPRYVLLALGIGTTSEDITALIEALQDLTELKSQISPNRHTIALMPSSPSGLQVTSDPLLMDWEEAVHGNAADRRRLVPVAECAGYRAAEMIVPYPPGIPLLYPGERITREQADYLGSLAALGSRFHGHDVSGLGTVPVRKE